MTKASSRQVGGDHYKNLGIEPWTVVDTWPLQQRIGYYRGNALKYNMRLGSKDVAQQEALKSAHYSEKLAEVLAEAAVQEVDHDQLLRRIEDAITYLEGGAPLSAHSCLLELLKDLRA